MSAETGPVIVFVIGVVIWGFVLASGVDPVVTGLMIGLMAAAYTPARGDLEQASGLFRQFREEPTPELARTAAVGLTRTLSPNDRLQRFYHPWTSYVIVPLFAVANAGISGSMVRDMMLEAVESRFAAIQAPHALEWLTDNGSVYTAHETRAFATTLNLVPCFTPIQSPESNGISESFVKTFKRDYVRVNPLPDAITALRQIAGWFLDYNENHPHSGLKMSSPREFMRAQSQ